MKKCVGLIFVFLILAMAFNAWGQSNVGGIMTKLNALPVEFEHGSVQVADFSWGNLRKQTALLKQLPAGTVVEIRIVSLATINKTESEKLARARSERLKSILVAFGVSAESLRAWDGSSKTLKGSAPVGKRFKNNRVEYAIVKSGAGASNVATPVKPARKLTLTGCVIVLGKGCNSMVLGATQAEIESLFGKPEYYNDAASAPDGIVSSFYSKGVVAVYDRESLRVKILRIIGVSKLYGSKAIIFRSFRGKPDKNLTWKTSAKRAIRAYGEPAKRKSFQGYETLYYPGGDLLFKGDRLYQINIYEGIANPPPVRVRN